MVYFMFILKKILKVSKAALTPNFSGCKPGDKLHVSFVCMILWLFSKYADLKPIGEVLEGYNLFEVFENK